MMFKWWKIIKMAGEGGGMGFEDAIGNKMYKRHKHITIICKLSSFYQWMHWSYKKNDYLLVYIYLFVLCPNHIQLQWIYSTIDMNDTSYKSHMLASYSFAQMYSGWQKMFTSFSSSVCVCLDAHSYILYCHFISFIL